MGGIGKTTLAQLVYNDAKVNSYFDMKAWACVSEEFDGVKVTKTILKSFSSDNCDDNDLNLLQVKLKEKLYAKKFLVILDDVWNENYNDWTILRAPFEVGAPGSRIVITTRNESVSSMMGTIPTYALKELSDDACLSIFTRNALGTKDFNAHPDLKDIGEEIVNKCKGLPLAAKTLGGLLRTKLDRSEWEDVLNSKIWEIPEERSGIVPALMLSYYHLPSHLKRCFAYCSILPKDYEFEEQQLVLLWMAEGLIQLKDGRKSPEDLGSEYFRNLLSRSFFQQSSKDKSRFLMHDLINDLAQWVAGDICFRMGDKLEVNNIGKFSKQVRHFSYLGGRYDATKRVLSLSGYCITELPDSIVDLKHLRYIDLSLQLTNIDIRELCLSKEIAFKVWESCQIAPPQYSKRIFIGRNASTTRLENVTVPRDARDANLIGKPGLNELLLEWSSKIDESQDRTNELDVLNMLQPPKALKKLTIRCYGGTRFPTWLRGPSFPNMVLLRIENCKKCASLPPVGQLPSLKVLFIKGMARVNNVGPEFYGEGCSQPFRSLETLCFENMQEWESWTPYGEFPCLRQLSITSCPKLLGKLPNQLPSLENFVINGCGQLVVSVSSFPMLCNIEIEKSKGIVQGGKVELSSLNFTFLSTMSEFTCQMEGPIQGLEKVEDLTIDHCEELVSLWSNDVGLQHLRALRVLKISTCPKLMSLVAEEVEEQLQLGLPSTLREIEIINCNALVSLPKAMMYNITCLERISIDRCDSLTSFAIGQLPPTLKRLKIDRCKNMIILLDEEDVNYFCSNKSLLEYLEAIECPSLKSLTSSGELPATLKQLHISSCQNLESIAKRLHDNSSLERISVSDCDNFKSLPMGIHTLSFLDEIHIWNCPSLVTLSDGGLLPTSLRMLWIFGCEDMQALPKCIHNLTSLQELNIWECPVGFGQVHLS
ncbi:putative disease resistance protein RGA3 [Quercus lobata]|uniref:putative disease resistance protein RGA3 n=1 Tax=Quercus lobata TaxID=97700 RepID=UPI0012482843|nr:putative disease resistance protein RGA3 [Quercus lobata]